MNKKSLLFASAALATLAIAQQDNQVQADSVAPNANADTAVTKDASSEASSTVKLDQVKETEKTEANQAKETEKAETTTSEVKPAAVEDADAESKARMEQSNRLMYEDDQKFLKTSQDFFNDNLSSFNETLALPESEWAHGNTVKVLESSIKTLTSRINTISDSADSAERNGWWGAEEFRSLIPEYEALRAQYQAVLDGTTTEEPKTEEPKVEEPKTEEPKAEEPKVEEPKTEKPKTEAPKTEKPKTEAPKTEKPKTEAPKTEKPKVIEKKNGQKVDHQAIIDKHTNYLNNLIEQAAQLDEFSDEYFEALSDADFDALLDQFYNNPVAMYEELLAYTDKNGTNEEIEDLLDMYEAYLDGFLEGYLEDDEAESITPSDKAAFTKTVKSQATNVIANPVVKTDNVASADQLPKTDSNQQGWLAVVGAGLLSALGLGFAFKKRA
ncbi:LPXTG cell wall anchor domain-containing protein [Weissella minor]|uniref:Gram-positive cocci surface proteins LPxTG domain-containing protein n=1 Tax=Weissella minor TaxID=1620 RepID=A0A0R2JI70_9LACO|nr:LPXTG cell wall anchor domain-containing protein [Weissella minor]KRN76991.1 hypothetical protein IV67_GL000504 [Weissella minor]